MTNSLKNGIVFSSKKIEVEKIEIDFLGLILSQSKIYVQDHIATKIKDYLDELRDKK